MNRGYGVEEEAVLRIDRHRLGPRVYLLGARVHEWHLGVALLLGLLVGGLFDRVGDNPATAVAILAGVKGADLERATHFVEFLLSKEGQLRWATKPGSTKRAPAISPPFVLCINQPR